MEYKILAAYLAVGLQILSYLFYFYGIYKGKTKPHAFTWFVWGIMNIVAFAAIFLSGGGAGAWIIFANIIGCFFIAGIGFYQKHVEYDRYDWYALVGSLVGVILWLVTENALYAIILVSVSDFVALIPTFRKAYRAPFEENASSFAIGVIHYPLSILALQTLTVTTWLYPAVIALLDGILALLIVVRRKKLTTS
jgi:hypothetical protein